MILTCLLTIAYFAFLGFLIYYADCIELIFGVITGDKQTIYHCGDMCGKTPPPIQYPTYGKDYYYKK